MLSELGNSFDESIKLVAIGKGGAHVAMTWSALKDVGFLVDEVGLCNSEQVSSLLLSCDFGISSCPPDLIEKSSAAAVMFAHGLHLLVLREPLWGTQYLQLVREQCPSMVLPIEMSVLDQGLASVANGATLDTVAETFLRSFPAA